jgi:hypothetical protein
MLVFIDESGDPGFLVEQGSTPVFVVAMVIFEDGAAARATEAVIRDAMAALRVRPEFKFNKSSHAVRDGFFQAVRGCPFAVRAIVVRKDIIRSAFLRTNKRDFYRYFVRQVMTHDGGVLANARIVIDGSGDRAFRRMLATQLRRHVGSGKLKGITFAKSHGDPLVQLADMCAGAIARSYRPDRTDRARWRRMLRPRIDDIWDFR